MDDRKETRLHSFGCPCHIVVENTDGSGEELLLMALGELHRLEARFCSFTEGSLVNRINRLAGTAEYVPLDAEAKSLFDYVHALWSGSNRLFDPTACALQGCYEGNGVSNRSKRQLQTLLTLVGWSRVERKESGVRLPDKGMLLDLNSCIRPYAVDKVRKLLLSQGVKSALVDLDRDIATIGRQPDGANWMVGLRYPRGSRTAMTRIKLNEGAFAIRGDFERCLFIAEERYGRALSPVDGYPIPGLLSIALTAESCLTACSAATAARLKTEPTALRWLENLGLPWLAIDRELRCHGPLAP